MARITIEQHFSTLPKKIRVAAMSYTPKHLRVHHVDSLDKALDQAFTWERTTERHAYWSKIFELLSIRR